MEYEKTSLLYIVCNMGFENKTYGLNLFVTTLALGSRPRQKGYKGAGQEECERVWA